MGLADREADDRALQVDGIPPIPDVRLVTNPYCYSNSAVSERQRLDLMDEIQVFPRDRSTLLGMKLITHVQLTKQLQPLNAAG